MFSTGSLLEEMQKVISDLVVIIIDEIVNSNDNGIPMYDDPERGNFSPALDATAAQQRVIKLAQAYACPIFLIQSDDAAPVGCAWDDHYLSVYAMKTKPPLRILLRGNTKVINKHNPNAFIDTDLANILMQEYRNPTAKNLVVMGWHAKVCVAATIGIDISTRERYSKGPGAIQHNFTVLTCQQVLNGYADWRRSADPRIRFFRKL